MKYTRVKTQWVYNNSFSNNHWLIHYTIMSSIISCFTSAIFITLDNHNHTSWTKIGFIWGRQSVIYKRVINEEKIRPFYYTEASFAQRWWKHFLFLHKTTWKSIFFLQKFTQTWKKFFYVKIDFYGYSRVDDENFLLKYGIDFFFLAKLKPKRRKHEISFFLGFWGLFW